LGAEYTPRAANSLSRGRWEEARILQRQISPCRQPRFASCPGRILGPETVLDTSLGLESIDFAELAVRLETEFDKDPSAIDDVPPIRTIADLAALCCVT
jgi:hypothetical protein